MFKDVNDADLEQLAQSFSVEEISSLDKLFDYITKNNLSNFTDSELNKNKEYLNKIVQLKMDQSFYVFDVWDSWAEDQTGVGAGLSLYRRIGDNLKGMLSHSLRDSVPQKEHILKVLKDLKAKEIFTGEIPYKGFLDLNYKSIDEQDKHIIELNPLDNFDAKYFESNEIKVVYLDNLI